MKVKDSGRLFFVQNYAEPCKIYLARPEFSWILAVCMSTTSMAIFSYPLFATYSVYARNASIFDRNFEKIVAPPNDENENYVAHLKEPSLLKKRWKPRRNRALNGNAVLVRTMQPSNARPVRTWLERWLERWFRPVIGMAAEHSG